MFTWLFRLMGFIIEFIYNFIPNYGVALIIFTILIKLLILPLNLKSQRSMVKQQKLMPQLQELQRKYANDKEKLNCSSPLLSPCSRSYKNRCPTSWA